MPVRRAASAGAPKMPAPMMPLIAISQMPMTPIWRTSGSWLPSDPVRRVFLGCRALSIGDDQPLRANRRRLPYHSIGRMASHGHCRPRAVQRPRDASRCGSC